MITYTQSDGWKKPTIKNIYLASLSFRFEGKIKGSTDKQKPKGFNTTELALQEMLKGLLLAESKG